MRLKLAAFGLVVVLLAVAPFVVSGHHEHQLALVGAYFVAILGLDLLRLGGQASLGQGAFMGIGGATAALLCGRHGYGPLWALVLGIVAAAAAGLAASLAGRRGLPVVTLSLALALPSVLGRVGPVTFGPVRHGYLLTWLAAGVLFLIAWLLVESGFARLVRAVRDNEPAAVAAGVDAAVYRAASSTLAAGYAGAAGALVTLAAGHVDSGMFPVELSLLLLAAAVAGALGSIWAALAGAIAVELLAGHHPELVLGVALIAALAVARTVKRT
jgi:branched-chain amino acid transport system permease protein